MGCHLGGPMVGLMGPPPWGLMPRAGWPRSAATRAPAHAAGHCRPVPLQQTLKHSKEYLAQSLCGLWPLLCTRAAWALLACLAYRGFESQCNFHPPPPTILLGLILYPLTWGIFFWWDPTFSVKGCSVVSCSFGVLAGEMSSNPSTPPSCVLYLYGLLIINNVSTESQLWQKCKDSDNQIGVLSVYKMWKTKGIKEPLNSNLSDSLDHSVFMVGIIYLH